MSTRATSATVGVRPRQPGDRNERRLRLPRLRDAKIRSKLAVILIVPVIAIVGLAALRLVDSGTRAVEAELVHSLTELSADVNALSHEVQRERMAAAGIVAGAGSKKDLQEKFDEQVRITDERITEYTRQREALGSVPGAAEARLDNIDNKLSSITAIRKDVLAQQTAAVSEVVVRYGVIITDLVAYGEVIGQIAGEGDLADTERAVAAFSANKAATGDAQAVAFAALADSHGNPLRQEQLLGFSATLTAQQAAQNAFSLAATPLLESVVESSITGDAVFLADRMETELSRSVGSRPDVTAAEVGNAFGAVHSLKRFAEMRLERKVLADAEAERTAVLRQVLTESALVLIILAIAVTLAVVLARSMVHSLTRLREGALSVAHRDLPDAVARLRDVRSLGEGGPEEISRQVRDPIRLPNKDEVGQVAVAFNVVHREAVRIAAEQAALRTSVSAMFLNLARRSQALVDRMIGELDKIERNEEDPKRLAQLFQLDHLATRMRRNDENLLVLAGADSSAPRREDALLVDALRAAQSEVEQYDRVEFGTIDTDVSVSAHAVNDVVRLAAELLDNATRFSPPNQAVVCEARRVRDYALIQIEDRGLGMSEEQLAALNARLAEPPTVDVAAFRMMGLAVVGRLADRYQIRVELRHNPEGGTIAQVSLPTNILILPKLRSREPLLARPRAPLAVETGPSGWSTSTAPALPPARPGTLTDSRLSDQTIPTGLPAMPMASPTSAAPTSATPTSATPSGPAATAASPSAWPGVGAGGYGYSVPASPPPTPHTPAPARAVPPAHGQNAGPSAPAAQPSADETTELPIFREIEAVWFRAHGSRDTGGNAENWSMPTAGYPPPPVVPAGGAAPGTVGNAPGNYSQPPAVSTAGNAATAGNATAGNSTAGNATAGNSTAGNAATAGNTTAGSHGAVRTSPPAAYAPPAVPPSAVPPSAAGSGAGGDSHPWRTAADEGWRRASAAAAPAVAGSTRSGLPKRVPQAQLVPGGVAPAGGQNRAKRTPDEVRGLLSAYHRGVQRGRSAGAANGEPRATEETP